LIQTIGRAARNVEGRCILYGDKITDAMKLAIDETDRRRAIQEEWNAEHGITPATIKRAIESPLAQLLSDTVEIPKDRKEQAEAAPEGFEDLELEDIPKKLRSLRAEMKAHAQKLEYEAAASVRDQLRALEQYALELSGEL
jgi:excinuclease ABC subunit B